MWFKRFTNTHALCFAVFAVLIGITNAQAQHSVACAKELQYCPIESGTGPVLISYGSGDTFVHIMTENVPKVLCSMGIGGVSVNITGEFGQFARIGNAKKNQCSYRVADPSVVSSAGWETCAKNGGSCTATTAPGAYQLMRYGNIKRNRWAYIYVAGKIKCNNDTVMDSAPDTKKVCQLQRKILTSFNRKDWITCAARGQTCDFQGKGTYLLRYGSGDRHNYRVFTGGTLDCLQESFRHDPAPDTQKTCSYIAMRSIKKLTGHWVRLENCPGCSEIEYSSTVGVEKGKAVEKSETWSTEMTVSTEGGVEADGVGEKTSVSFSVGHSNTTAITNSFTINKTATDTFKCKKGAMWQFVASVHQNYCVEGDCVTVASGGNMLCTTLSDDPNKNPKSLAGAKVIAVSKVPAE